MLYEDKTSIMLPIARLVARGACTFILISVVYRSSNALGGVLKQYIIVGMTGAGFDIFHILKTVRTESQVVKVVSIVCWPWYMHNPRSNKRSVGVCA